MATIMIIHGGWGGGWEWTPVARRLRARGHDVYTPTLTGLGERAHLGGDIGLSSHIDDVLAVYEFEALRDVVLCGHSYGGMVVTGVADRVPQATKAVIYLDAMVPRDGQSVQAFFPELVDALIPAAKERGDGRAPLAAELEPPGGPVNDEQRAYLARVRPHPIKCFTEAARISGAVETLPRAYIRCVGAPGDVAETGMRAFADRAQAEGWPYREIETPHDLQLFDPDGTATLIDELVKGFR